MAELVSPRRRPRPPSFGAATHPHMDEMIRVDHAGEYGAVRIYAGQRAVFSHLPSKRRLADYIAGQEAEESVHLKAFDTLIHERAVRPTVFAPVWDVAGYALGVATALMGEKAAHACTAAVEQVIEQHYAAQEDELGQQDPSLKAMIATFRADETAHKEHALASGAQQAFGWPVLQAVIRVGCQAAIAVSKKL